MNGSDMSLKLTTKHSINAAKLKTKDMVHCHGEGGSDNSSGENNLDLPTFFLPPRDSEC